MDPYQVKSGNCQGLSKIIPRMVTHQPNDGHPQEGSMLQTQNLALTLKSQKKQGQEWSPTILRMVTYHSWDGHPPTQEWSPTNLRMVTHQKEVYYRLGIWHLHITHKTRLALFGPLLPCSAPFGPV